MQNRFLVIFFEKSAFFFVHFFSIFFLLSTRKCRKANGKNTIQQRICIGATNQSEKLNFRKKARNLDFCIFTTQNVFFFIPVEKE